MLDQLKTDFPFPTSKPEVPLDDHGWLSPHVKEMFKPLIKNMKLIVEVGSWLGKSTRFWLENSNAHIICIDTWEGSEEHQLMPEIINKLPTLYETFIANQWAWKERITPVRMWSSSALPLLSQYDIMPDFIYLDASHDANDVYVDLVTARNCFPNALIGGDDWNYKNRVRDDEKTVQHAVKLYCNFSGETYRANHWGWYLEKTLGHS